VPVVSADGVRDGISHDGRALVLQAVGNGSPSRFALLHTSLKRPPVPIELRGEFSYDAVSRNGSLVYFVEHLPPRGSSNYAVRVHDVAQGGLRPDAVADKRNLHTVMAGQPMARTKTSDGRWVFTLYRSTDHIFVHSLEVDRAQAICLDVAHVGADAPSGDWRLSLSGHGTSLRVVHGDAVTDLDVGFVRG